MIRLIHGQGLAAPHELDPSWQRILFPVRIEDRVQLEQQVARSSGFRHQISSLQVGHTHRITDGRVADIYPAAGVQLLDKEEERTFALQEPFFPALPVAPLRDSPRDIVAQKHRILELLNHTFLPYLHGLRAPPVLHLLSEHGGEYRIRIQYGTPENMECKDYVLSFRQLRFTEPDPVDGPAQEQYWANDIADFLDGLCDEFTVFCRAQLPSPFMRLWTCLSTPLLNSSLAHKRIQLHFERAQKGLTAGSWVMPLYQRDH